MLVRKPARRAWNCQITCDRRPNARINRHRRLAEFHNPDLAGIDRTYVSALERQVYSASLDTIEKLAGVLGAEPHELLTH